MPIPNELAHVIALILLGMAAGGVLVAMWRM